MTTRDLDETARLLRAPFPKASIGKLPKGGAMLEYVGHAAVTERLLAVDPEWSWEPLAFDESGLPRYDVKGGLWIRLTIGGVTRLGYGDGPDPKVRIGDAIRNAAMRFGVALDLWAKEDLLAFAHVDHLTHTEPAQQAVKRDTKADAGEWATEPDATNVKPIREQWQEGGTASEPQMRAINALARSVGVESGDRETRNDLVSAVLGRTITSTKELTVADASKVIDALKRAEGQEPGSNERTALWLQVDLWRKEQGR